jgi:Skp family chaperone for outer membrane proteins
MSTKSILRLHRFALAAVVAGMTFVSGQAAQAAAASHPAPILGVVDTDLLLQKSLAAQGVRLERDKFANSYQALIKDEDTKLRTEDQALSQQRGVLAPDVFQQRAQDFQKKITDFQAQVKEKQYRLDYSFQLAMQEIGNTIMVVSSEVAKTEGINAVLARSQLMIFDPGMDITNAVLEKLNQRLPSVKFQDPATLQIPAEGQAVAAAGAPGAAPATPIPAPKAPAKK